MTKTEAFAYRAARSGPKKPSQSRRPRRDRVVDTSLPGVSATDRKVGLRTTSERNRSNRAERKAAYVLEDGRPPRPSRKSTRQSKNRIKADNPIRWTETLKSASPKRRAASASAARKTTAPVSARRK